MRLREIGISIAAGVAIFALAFTFPVVAGIVAAAGTFWYLGAAALLAALLLGRLQPGSEPARALGVLGIIWGTLILVPIALLFVVMATGRWGY